MWEVVIIYYRITTSLSYFLAFLLVCGGGSNNLLQNYYLPFIFLSLSTRVCLGGNGGHGHEKNIYSIYLYRREIKRIQYNEGKKLTATRKLG